MKRGFLVAVGGAAIVVAGLSGCSSGGEKSESTEASPTASVPTTTSAVQSGTAQAGDASAITGSGSARVLIDGQERPVQGTVVCASAAGNVSLTVGEGMSVVTATVSEGDQPTVGAVGLGNIDGVNLGFTPGVPGASAEATKDGNTYTIKGSATGADLSNPAAGVVTKPFELEVTCP
ncbi:lipoprotein LpqH [Mycobacterium sp. NPDC003449]